METPKDRLQEGPPTQYGYSLYSTSSSDCLSWEDASERQGHIIWELILAFDSCDTGFYRAETFLTRRTRVLLFKSYPVILSISTSVLFMNAHWTSKEP